MDETVKNKQKNPPRLLDNFDQFFSNKIRLLGTFFQCVYNKRHVDICPLDVSRYILKLLLGHCNVVTQAKF